LVKKLKKYFELFKFEDEKKTKEQEIQKQSKFLDQLKKILQSLNKTNVNYIEKKKDYKNSAYYPIFSSKYKKYDDIKETMFLKAYSNLVESCKIGLEAYDTSNQKKGLINSFSNVKILNRLKSFLVFLKQDPIYCQKKLLEILDVMDEDKEDENRSISEDNPNDHLRHDWKQPQQSMDPIKEEMEGDHKEKFGLIKETYQPSHLSVNAVKPQEAQSETGRSKRSGAVSLANIVAVEDQKPNAFYEFQSREKFLSITLVLKFMTTNLIPNLLYKVLIEYTNIRISYNVSDSGNIIFSSYELLEKILIFLRYLCYKSNQVFQTYLLRIKQSNINFSFSDLMIDFNLSIINYVNDAIHRKKQLSTFRHNLGNEKYFDRLIKAYSDFRISLIQNGLNNNSREIINHSKMEKLVITHSSSVDSLDGNQDLVILISSFFKFVNSIVEEYADDYPKNIDHRIVKNIQIYNVGKMMLFCIWNFYEGVVEKERILRLATSEAKEAGKVIVSSSFNKRYKNLQEFGLDSKGSNEMLNYYLNYMDKKDHNLIYLELCINCYIYLNLCDNRFNIEKARNELKILRASTDEDMTQASHREKRLRATNKEMMKFIETIIVHIELFLLTEARNKEIWKDTNINKNLHLIFPKEILEDKVIKELMGTLTTEEKEKNKEEQEKEEEEESISYEESSGSFSEDDDMEYDNSDEEDYLEEEIEMEEKESKKEEKKPDTDKDDEAKQKKVNIKIIEQEDGEYFLNKVFFQCHPHSLKISDKMVEWIRNEAPEDYNKKINFLIQKIGVVEDGMNMKVSLRGNKLYEFLYELNFMIVQWICAILLLAINIFFMWETTMEKTNDNLLELEILTEDWADNISLILNIVNLVIAGLAIANYLFFETLLYLKYKIPRKYGKRDNKKNPIKELYPFFSDKRVFPLIWNVVFGLLAISAEHRRYFYSFQLLAVTSLSSTMSLAVYSVYLRGAQFVSSAILALIIMLFYAGISFFFYNSPLNSGDDQLCTNYRHCFVSMINFIKMGGGIGDQLGMVSWENNDYWGRLFYDWTYFFLIILLLVNIINGIVVDTFQQEREDDNKHRDAVENKCFICDQKKTVFLLNGVSYNHHIKFEHNLFNYIHFLMKLKLTDSGELSTTECMIKSKDLHSQVNFFPKDQALSTVKNEDLK